jgi:hypothetical protein
LVLSRFPLYSVLEGENAGSYPNGLVSRSDPRPSSPSSRSFLTVYLATKSFSVSQDPLNRHCVMTKSLTSWLYDVRNQALCLFVFRL